MASGTPPRSAVELLRALAKELQEGPFAHHVEEIQEVIAREEATPYVEHIPMDENTSPPGWLPAYGEREEDGVFLYLNGHPEINVHEKTELMANRAAHKLMRGLIGRYVRRRTIPEEIGRLHEVMHKARKACIREAPYPDRGGRCIGCGAMRRDNHDLDCPVRILDAEIPWPR